MTFTDTATYQRVSAQNAALQYQYDAETRRIERELQQPWPAIENVYDVTVRASHEGNIVIDVSNTRFEVVTRVRKPQDALAEIVGFWGRAEVGLIMEPSTPADVREYLDALADVAEPPAH